MRPPPPSHSRHSQPSGAPVGDGFWCRCLGELTLFSDPDETRPVMQAGKPLAILVYVGLAPAGRADRDHVAELFWPGVDLSDARHSLRQALYRLRQASGGEDLIRAEGTELEVPPSVRLACLEAESALAREDLEQAWGLLRGNFLEGFSLSDSPEFESWAESQRTRFRESRTQVGRTLAERHLEAGERQRALEIAEGLLAVQPFDADAIRLLMRALAEQGRHATAVARFHAYAELLERELDEEPQDELRSYARELDGYLKMRPEASFTELPLVGRSRQWSELEGAWDSAREAKGPTVLIEGATGLGKTRLLNELRRRVEAGGGLVLEAKCYEIERNVPYAAIAEALSAAVHRDELRELTPTWLAEVARLLPELRERFPELPETEGGEGSQASKRRLHGAIARYVEALAAGGPVLLAVDDIHWADAPSLEVLHLLSHRLEAATILQVATYRPAELAPEARRFARSLCSSRLAGVVALEPLEIGDICNLIETLGEVESDAIAAAVADSLHRHSGGNPLIVSELLEALERDGVLLVRAGRWGLAPGAELEDLPNTLSKLFADRIDGLTPWMRALIETLAVAGDEVAVEVLARALDLSEPRAELALSVLQEERLVRRSGSDSFELTHDELRRLVYQGIPDQRRALLHGAFGRSLEEGGESKRPGGGARLSYHFDQAGDLEKAHEYALLAAEEAEALSAPEARRAHLDLAAAHSPRALPPGTTEGRSGARRAAGFVIGALTVIVAASLAVGGFFLRPSSEGTAGESDFRQGTLYLSASGRLEATHKLQWPSMPSEPGDAVQLAEPPPEFLPQIVTRWITGDGETHGKIFRVDGRDTVQLTFGRSDDHPIAMSPDGRLVLVNRGWKASEEHWQDAAFVMDFDGRLIRRLTHSRYADHPMDWSPTGARVLFQRDSLDTFMLWICDADGSNASNLTTEFDLPTTPGHAVFSPDGKRVAAIYPDDGSGSPAVYVVTLDGTTVRSLRLPRRSGIGGPPRWSPDAEWLAYAAQQEEGMALWLLPVDPLGEPRLLASLPAGVTPVRWTDGRPRYAASVRIEPVTLTIRTGHGLRSSAFVQTPDGEPIDVPIRWSTADTTIARVDELGFVRGARPGATRLIASAGGFRADTAEVLVSFAPPDTILYDDWTAGIDTAVWRPFGQPRPQVVAESGPDGRPAFWNNGDFNHHSGVVSTARFDPGAAGMSVEAEAWLQFDGTEWQDWRLAVATDPLRLVGAEWTNTGGEAHVQLSGHDTLAPRPQWFGGTPLQRAKGDLDPDSINGGWHRIVIQVRPDTVAETYMNGALLFRGRLPAETWGVPLALVLGGRSEGTRIYHGPIVVTRGLRY